MTARGRRLAAAVALAGIVGAGPAAAVSLTDQAGRPLSLPAPPRRIVSLVPSVTEILFALGAEERLAGVTDFCDYPAAARAKPHVGGMLAPSLETIVALRPDLVVATAAGNTEETFGQLRRLGLPVYVVNPGRMDEVLDLIERLGAITERRAAAATLVAGLRRRVQAVVLRVAPLPAPRVLYVLWPEPLIVPGRGALVSELIELAGGRSVTLGAGEGYPRLGLEAALAQAPEVIVLARHGLETRPLAREPWTRFTGLPAVRHGRLYSVDGDVFHRYGPRLVDALEELARLFHPGAAGR